MIRHIEHALNENTEDTNSAKIKGNESLEDLHLELFLLEAKLKILTHEFARGDLSVGEELKHALEKQQRLNQKISRKNPSPN